MLAPRLACPRQVILPPLSASSIPGLTRGTQAEAEARRWRGPAPCFVCPLSGGRRRRWRRRQRGLVLPPASAGGTGHTSGGYLSCWLARKGEALAEAPVRGATGRRRPHFCSQFREAWFVGFISLPSLLLSFQLSLSGLGVWCVQKSACNCAGLPRWGCSGLLSLSCSPPLSLADFPSLWLHPGRSSPSPTLPLPPPFNLLCREAKPDSFLLPGRGAVLRLPALCPRPPCGVVAAAAPLCSPPPLLLPGPLPPPGAAPAHGRRAGLPLR